MTPELNWSAGKVSGAAAKAEGCSASESIGWSGRVSASRKITLESSVRFHACRAARRASQSHTPRAKGLGGGGSKQGGAGRQRTWNLVHVVSHLAFFCWYSAPRSYRSAVTWGPSTWLHRIASTCFTSHDAEASSSCRGSVVRLRLRLRLGLGLRLRLELRPGLRVRVRVRVRLRLRPRRSAPVCPARRPR